MPSIFSTILSKIALFFTAAAVSFSLSAGAAAPHAPLPQAQVAAIALATSTPAQLSSAAVVLDTVAASNKTFATSETRTPSAVSNEPSTSSAITAYITQDQLAEILSQLASQLRSQFNQAISNSTSGANAPLTPAGFSWSQKIDQLANTTLTNVTVSKVTGLTNSDIPDLSALYLNIASTSAARSSLGLGYISASDVVTSTNIATWGDSMAAGAGGGGTTFQTALAALTGYNIYNGGAGGETSTQIKVRFDAATSKHSWPTIIWTSRNNYTDPATVKSDIAAMVASLTAAGNHNYLILGAINGNYATEYVGESGYNTIVQLNNDLEAVYGDNFIDIRSYIISLYDQNQSQDVIDHGLDIPPASLRADNVHLTAAGYTAVAQKIYEHIATLRPSALSQSVLTGSGLSDIFGAPPIVGLKTPNQGYFSSISLGTTTSAGLLHVDGESNFRGAMTLVGTNLQFRTTAGAGSASLFPSGNGQYVTVGGLGIIAQTDGSSDLGYSTSNYRFNNVYLKNAIYASSTYLTNSIIIGTSSASLGAPALEVGNNGSLISGTIASFGQANSTGRWSIENAGNPTTRRLLKGYSGTTEVIRFNPAGASFFGQNLSLAVGTSSTSDALGVYGSIGIQAVNAQLNIRNGNSATTFSVDFPELSSAAGEVRFFRSTNNSADLSVKILRGDGTNTVQTSLHTVGNSYLNALGGNVGIASTTPWRKFAVTGTVGFDGLTGAVGAGSLCLSATKEVVYNSGSDSCLPSLRSTKHDILPLSISATNTIAALWPVSFIYNYDASSTVRYGFIAEDTAAIDMHLATYNAEGKLSGIDDRSLIAVLVKAVQEIMQTISGFAERFVSNVLVAKQQLCVGSTCVTEAQLKTLLAGSPAPSVQISDPVVTITGVSSAPPTITLMGNNPTTVHVGDDFTDLGAIAKDGAGSDLGHAVFLNGALVSSIVVDTATVGTYTIDYVATDTWGNTSTSTRTVIVEPATQAPGSVTDSAASTTSSAQ